ncbi:MAG: ribonuclease PH [Pseudomonadota bacterium]|nr:ribonuclease PH [Pseudomonadota bacterium]
MTNRRDRSLHAMRPILFSNHFTKHADGSVLACCGDTKVLCNTSISEGVPKFLRDQNKGWLTAEYSMLPRATHTRTDREASRGKQTGRTIEIQRLIGRSLRCAVDLHQLGEYTITIDCDVIQADGGTRTTAINGAMVSLTHALKHLQYAKKIKTDPIKYLITACSIGVIKDEVYLDLDYDEDSCADVDCNIVLTEHGDLVEIQGTAEGEPFQTQTLDKIVQLAKSSQTQILQAMRTCLDLPHPESK